MAKETRESIGKLQETIGVRIIKKLGALSPACFKGASYHTGSPGQYSSGWSTRLSGYEFRVLRNERDGSYNDMDPGNINYCIDVYRGRKLVSSTTDDQKDEAERLYFKIEDAKKKEETEMEKRRKKREKNSRVRELKKLKKIIER